MPITMGQVVRASRLRCAPVNSFKPNGHGLLYDMTGNVWKWCADWYDENYDSDPSAKKLLGPSSGSSRLFHRAWISHPVTYT